jgi:hypothetical protein
MSDKDYTPSPGFERDDNTYEMKEMNELEFNSLVMLEAMPGKETKEQNNN